jgi:hypothetical protein
MKGHIKEGDIVAVDFNGAQYTLCRSAIVEYIPCATGDSWVFKDTETGEVHYVSEGCTVTLLKQTSEERNGRSR